MVKDNFQYQNQLGVKYTVSNWSIFYIYGDTRWSTTATYFSTDGTFIACSNYSGLVSCVNSMFNHYDKFSRGVEYSPNMCSLYDEMHEKLMELCWI